MIRGTARVRCPACGVEQDTPLVQSINTRSDPATKQKLIAGELNVLACACGHRTQLAATLLYHDPDAGFYAQVVPGGPGELEQARALFRATLATTGAIQRLVPTQNALLEKVKLLEAGLLDWAVEMTKVLLLAALGEGELTRVLLFERVAADAGVIHWVLFDEHGREPRHEASPLAQYEKLLRDARRAGIEPPAGELQIDRAWALEAVRALIAAGERAN